MAATWTQLAIDIKAKIQQLTESGQWNVQSVTSLDGVTHSFYSLEELMRYYDMVQSYAQAEEDAGNTPKWRPIYMRRGSFRSR